MNVSVTLTGEAEIQRHLDAFPRETMHAIGGSLYREANDIIAISQEHYVPVDYGVLRDSGHVELPVEASGEVSVELGFGGAAQDYAVVQHEDLTLNHPNGGQAKYLEIPLLERADGMLARVAGDVRRDLGLGQ